MERIAAEFHDWLKRHNIDPQKVKWQIRADDDWTCARIQVAIQSELKPLMFSPSNQFTDFRNMELHGIKMSINSLDRSAA